MRVDTRLDFNAADTPSDEAFGTAFNDWLLMVIAKAMGGEDDQEDITHGRRSTSKRFKFTWRRVKVSARPSGQEGNGQLAPMAAETGFWEMEVPDEIADGGAGDGWTGVFTALARTFLTNPYVRPGRTAMRLLESKGFDTVEKAVEGLLPGDIVPDSATSSGISAEPDNQPQQPEKETADELPPEHQP